jgi:secreted trypsin-like serine protease
MLLPPSNNSFSPILSPQMLLESFLVLLFSLVRSSSQVTYSCDLSARCGCSASSVSIAKIVGGEDALANTWGWAVSLSISEQWLCGGSILSSSWILTAAHCVYGAAPEDVFVSAGTNKLYGAKQWRFGSAVIVHPEYDDYLVENDIALVQVWPPFNMTDVGIAQICLPSEVTNDYPPIGASVSCVQN